MRRARHNRFYEFQADHYVDIFAEKRGGTSGLLECSRIMTIQEISDQGIDAVADDFCKRAVSALK